jgi:general secretion pathway protein E/type IV pilus assembly protein PilB
MHDAVADILVRKGWLTAQAAAELAARLNPGEPPHAGLIRLGLVPEDRVMRAVAQQWQLPFVDLESVRIDPELVDRVNADVAVKRLVKDRLLLPYQRVGGLAAAGNGTNGSATGALPAIGSGTVAIPSVPSLGGNGIGGAGGAGNGANGVRGGATAQVAAVSSASAGGIRVAVADPGDLPALDELARRMRAKVSPVVSPRGQLERIIRETFGIGEADPDAEEGKAGEGVSDEVKDAQDTAVVRLVREIIEYAVRSRASDIHIEPYEKKLRVRFRIDGVLHDAPLPDGIHKREKAIVARIKILAGLKTDEKRLPQDGRIKQAVNGKPIDFRVSIIPMLWGEGVVMRILDQSSVLLGLNDIGMSDRDRDMFLRIVNMPHGIFLVTGPTGSGKTTTLYTALNTINSEDIKIITIEDPVEYQLVGINQIEVKHKIGLTFAEGLRRILRHDPDVVLVGEIRDSETAEVATQASLTGHLVLSTLHTNDAPSAMTRLVDMGLEPYLAASTVEAVMAQRLVRILCPVCKETYDPSTQVLPPDLARLRPTKLWRPRGCNQCNNTGYKGRKGVFELMPVDDAIREMVIRKEGAHALKKYALANLGMRTLRQDGLAKVMEGKTTIDEVMRNTKEEELAFSDDAKADPVAVSMAVAASHAPMPPLSLPSPVSSYEPEAQARPS